jgi:hypothetical protein
MNEDLALEPENRVYFGGLTPHYLIESHAAVTSKAALPSANDGT